MQTDDTRYRCECGWEGTQDEMSGDYKEGIDGEWWSNWICPKCDEWWQLEDYEVVDAN